MNDNIKLMLEKNILYGGKIFTKDGFAMFQRLSMEEIKKLDDTEIAYATGSMGRAIFQIEPDGKIKNIKGVDSHLENDEIYMKQLVNANAVYIPNEGKTYSESTFPVNMIVFPGDGHADLRWRGASPLDDLEEEASVNARMQNTGVKLPQILRIREFNQEFAKEMGLPIKIVKDDNKLQTNYDREEEALKQFLKDFYRDKYQEENVENMRAETSQEYFENRGLFTSKIVAEFLKETGTKIDDFTNYYDRTYPNGARFGQSERILENPFRISDLEYFTKIGDKEAVNCIIVFTENMRIKKSMKEKSVYNEPFENNFAKQMGKNVACLMNSGWSYKELLHRQDFTLAAEMCDDMYFNFAEKLEHSRNPKYKDLYGLQFFTIGSNIKILQDEMKLRGKSQSEIESVVNDYVDSFTENLDFEKIGKSLSRDAKLIKKTYIDQISTIGHFVDYIVEKSGYNPKEEIAIANEGNEEFYRLIGGKIVDRLRENNIDKHDKSPVLSDAIKHATEVSILSAVNEQSTKIKESIKKDKVNEKDVEIEKFDK